MTLNRTKRGIYPAIKHSIDTVAAVVILILAFPIMFLAALAVKFSSKGPVFFKQKRPGKDEKIFCLYKFRTMTEKSEENIGHDSDSDRMTKVGMFLRKTSIDELPQLINILRQEMSFIGPRPLLVKYLPYYFDSERPRHSVRPGISGWAQVNGRNTLSWEDKFRYDVEYVEKCSFVFDVKIALLTIKKLFYGSEVVTAGTTQSTHALDAERRHLPLRSETPNTRTEA